MKMNNSIYAFGFLGLVLSGATCGAIFGVSGGRHAAREAEIRAAQAAQGHAHAVMHAEPGAKLPETEERDQIRKILARVQELGAKGSYQETYELLEHSTARFPNSVDLWLNRGIAERSLNRLDDAERSLRRALELKSDDWDVVAELATVKKSQGHVDVALNELEQIPAMAGRMRIRLRLDPVWQDLGDNPRMQALIEKHGAFVEGDTGMKRLEEIIQERRRQNVGSKTP